MLPAEGLNSSGEFGEVLAEAAYAVTQGQVLWDHWEQGPAGPLAVFSYAAEYKEHTRHHCPDELDSPPLLVHTHGEIGVNPADGSIVRLTEMRRYKWNPVGFGNITDEARFMVEYGPVEIGGSTYFSPTRSVAVGEGPPLLESRSAMDNFNRYYKLTKDPVSEGLSDITFKDYHAFRSVIHILPGVNVVSEAPATAPGATPKH